jgi:hypothetical protein
MLYEGDELKFVLANSDVLGPPVYRAKEIGLDPPLTLVTEVDGDPDAIRIEVFVGNDPASRVPPLPPIIATCVPPLPGVGANGFTLENVGDTHPCPVLQPGAPGPVGNPPKPPVAPANC